MAALSALADIALADVKVQHPRNITINGIINPNFEIIIRRLNSLSIPEQTSIDYIIYLLATLPANHNDKTIIITDIQKYLLEYKMSRDNECYTKLSEINKKRKESSKTTFPGSLSFKN